MTAPDIVVRGATVALTRRTNFRKAFLAPWHPGVAQAWWYCLALAQQATGVAVHQSTLIINHHHTEVTGTKENLPEFKRRLHGEFSKALNVLMAELRFDEPHQVWDDRGTHTMRLVDVEAQLAHMVYSHVNPVAAGLVRTPAEMPGSKSDFGLWKSGGFAIQRPDFYFDAHQAQELPVQLTPSCAGGARPRSTVGAEPHPEAFSSDRSLLLRVDRSLLLRQAEHLGPIPPPSRTDPSSVSEHAYLNRRACQADGAEPPESTGRAIVAKTLGLRPETPPAGLDTRGPEKTSLARCAKTLRDAQRPCEMRKDVARCAKTLRDAQTTRSTPPETR